ncbi:unnamed protein product [Bursaphelenchus xylophilus]|uniref:(pine wood nematode) hypothetical protein n=1 Tax=Bursaphelenchus xylophilus TaxID=6326 RepID=A0A1I7SL38_BURXY|nr:unnamed protein product [Bursaphelenchus xylophilus]CAG9129357.1 unnamed protein product [Bursaphelenchus xylophilus]
MRQPAGILLLAVCLTVAQKHFEVWQPRVQHINDGERLVIGMKTKKGPPDAQIILLSQCLEKFYIKVESVKRCHYLLGIRIDSKSITVIDEVNYRVTQPLKASYTNSNLTITQVMGLVTVIFTSLDDKQSITFNTTRMATTLKLVDLIYMDGNLAAPPSITVNTATRDPLYEPLTMAHGDAIKLKFQFHDASSELSLLADEDAVIFYLNPRAGNHLAFNQNFDGNWKAERSCVYNGSTTDNVYDLLIKYNSKQQGGGVDVNFNGMPCAFFAFSPPKKMEIRRLYMAMRKNTLLDFQVIPQNKLVV